MYRRMAVILLSFLLAGEPLLLFAAPAGTSQSAAAKKREAAKRKAAKKREAAKAAAARKAEKKHQEEKKRRIKEGKPLLFVYTYDMRSGEPLPATHVQVQDINARPGKKPLINKPTDQKRARASRGLPFGQYWVYAAKTGYFAGDTVRFNHREDEDTVRIALYPETRLTFTVTDSLTSRPVTANIVVRNAEQRKVMQTTSDSVHSVLAVLLDDRTPFYTIDATAVGYFPTRDTIVLPTDFSGVRMRPKEVKSFVLHNIYFATGKTRILKSSEPALNELYRLLTARPDLRIRVIGHTDNIGSDRSNQILSEGRSQEVRRAMTERGISAERIEYEGRGERDPIVPNDTEENRQKNRRVEIELLQ